MSRTKFDYEYDGDPNGVILGQKGDRCIHLSQNLVYVKTGGVSKTGWVLEFTGSTPSSPTSVVAIAAAPSGRLDFSTLPGGVAPSTGMFLAPRDLNSLWYIAGGDIEWTIIERSYL